MQTRHDKYTAYSISDNISRSRRQWNTRYYTRQYFRLWHIFLKVKLSWYELRILNNRTMRTRAWDQMEPWCAAVAGRWTNNTTTRKLYGSCDMRAARHLSLNIFMVTVPSDPVTAALQPGLSNFDIIAHSRCGEIVMLVCKTSTAFSKNRKFLKLPRLWISISMYKYILSKLDNAICSIAACCRQMCPRLLQVLSSPRLAQMFHSRSCLFLDCSLHCFSIQYFRLWKFGTPHTEKLGRFITM